MPCGTTTRTMPEVLLDRDGRNAAGLLQAIGFAAVAFVFGLIPLMSLAHPPAFSALAWALISLLAVVSLVSVIVAVRSYFGRERVLIDSGVLRVVRQVGPIRRERAVRLADITGVEVPFLGQEAISTRWGLRPAVLVRSSAGSLLCGAAVSPSEAEALAARIREATHA